MRTNYAVGSKEYHHRSQRKKLINFVDSREKNWQIRTIMKEKRMNYTEFEINRFNELSMCFNLGYEARLTNLLSDREDSFISVGSMIKSQTSEYWHEDVAIDQDGEKNLQFVVSRGVMSGDGYMEPPDYDEIDLGTFDNLRNAFDKILDMFIKDAMDSISESLAERNENTVEEIY